MGKKKKSKKPSTFEYFTGSGKLGKAMDRYGVEGVHYGHPDGRSGRENRSIEDVDKEIREAALKDYDTRRTLEAAAMSGKGKAKKILDSGFKNIGDVLNAQNFFEKAAKRHGQGGNFSSGSDYMGLTQSMVERDRNKLVASLSGKSTDENEDDNQSTPQSNNFFRSDYPSKRYAQLMGLDDEGNLKEDNPNKAGDEFRKSYTADVVAGLGLEEQTGLNLANAMAFVNDRSDDGDDDNRYYRGYSA